MNDGAVAGTNGDEGFHLGRLARAGVAIIVFGFFVFVIGIFPSLINLDITPGIGIFQIFVALVGITFMTLGAYVYMYTTRHPEAPRRLRHGIGLRLMATGLVFAYAAGLADVLGIGSHPATPLTRPYFGEWQAAGVVLGVILIVAGILLYSQRPKG
ncbi:MAG: hypothetical protein HY260_07095 [Chloroflexi bacterium]|nr:hypothetical protein [Chloroflexota bacterium]